MGAENKLLSDLGGRPLIAHVVERVLASSAAPVIVVTGHEGDAVAAALADSKADTQVRIVHNPDWPGGLSRSLRAGLAAVPGDAEGAVVCLGDMPEITPELIDALIAAFDPGPERAPDDESVGGTICVPVFEGRRGNPVLWGRGHFAEMAALEGDAGARRLMGVHLGHVREVVVDDGAVVRDVDTPEALAELRERTVSRGTMSQGAVSRRAEFGPVTGKGS